VPGVWQSVMGCRAHAYVFHPDGSRRGFEFSKAGQASQESRSPPGDNYAFLKRAKGGGCMAPRTRAFFSFSSVSVDAPTCLMTATPPTSLLKRSWSFSCRNPRGGLFEMHAELLDSASISLTCQRRDDTSCCTLSWSPLGFAQFFDFHVLEFDCQGPR